MQNKIDAIQKIIDEYTRNGNSNYDNGYRHGLRKALEILTTPTAGDKVSNGADLPVGSVVMNDAGCYFIKYGTDKWFINGFSDYNDAKVAGIVQVVGKAGGLDVCSSAMGLSSNRHI